MTESLEGKEQESQPFDYAEVDTKRDAPRLLNSCRLKFGLIVFTANLLCSLHRVNINMAIVCMLEDSSSSTFSINSNVTLDNETIQIPVITEYLQYNSNATKSIEQQINSKYTYRPQSVGPFIENKKITNTSMIYTKTGTLSSRRNNSDVEGVTENSNLGVHSEFSWDKTQISVILSSYYYGTVFAQIPGGFLSHHFGGKHVISVFWVVSAACSLLTPIAAKTNTALLLIIRILIGIAGGLFVPAVYDLTMHWTKPSQRSLFLAIMISGQPLGIAVAYMTSGFLCALGWSTIFYVHGAVTSLVMLLWLYEIYSSPTEHPRISKAELNYLTKHLYRNHSPVKKSVPPTPWKSILLSRPQWAATLVHFSFNWSLFTFIINVPLFLKEVFAYVITENGVYSAIPYIFNVVSMTFCGKLSATVAKKKWLTLQTTRKVFNAISLGGTAVCLLCVGQVTPEIRFLAVILICFSCTFFGFQFGGIMPSYAEFAGIFSGTSFAIGNTMGMLGVILSALTAGLLTPNGKQNEWQSVFYIAAGMNMFSTVVYSLFGEATVQKWAIVKDFNTIDEIEVALTDANNERKEIDVTTENNRHELQPLDSLKSE